MRLCHGCERHVRRIETRCPFCGTGFREAPAGAAVVLGAALMVTGACGDRTVDGGASASGTTTMDTAGSATGTSTSGTTSATGMSTSITTTGPGTTSTTDDSGSSGDSGCVFYGGCQPDGGGGSVECDIWAQDCLPGEKCMPWANDGGNSWNATKCTPVDPDPRGVGEPCTVEGNGFSGLDDCDVASMCWNVDPQTGLGTCVDFCTGSEAAPVCADPDAMCSITNNGVLILCLPTCDPLGQDCPSNQVCVPNPNGADFVCQLDQPGDKGAAGDPCEYLDACDPGLFCANADVVADCQGAVGCCAPFCDLSDPNVDMTCPGFAGGEACVPWFEMGMAPDGLENLGACVIPP